jgi:hypothetical protein
MAKRHDLRARYIQGWYDADCQALLDTTAPGFIFDDPAEPAPVTRDSLETYMTRWLTRTGGANEWRLTHETRVDQDGVLTDWEWWEVLGTDMQGTAVIVTTDEGVQLERITYFRRGAG